MTDTSKEGVEWLAEALPSSQPHSNNLYRAADTLRQLVLERDTFHAAQPYRYIGKDMKPILARNLEDQRDALQAQLDLLDDGLTTAYMAGSASRDVEVRKLKACVAELIPAFEIAEPINKKNAVDAEKWREHERSLGQPGVPRGDNHD